MAGDPKVKDIVLHYENYINDVLKEDLNRIDLNLQKINNEIAEFSQIKQSLEVIQDKSVFPKGIKTQVDVGCSFFIEAKVTDTSSLLLDIGLNHYLEFTKEEAEKFVEMRTHALERVVKDLTEKSAMTKAHIKLMLFGIGELQNVQSDSSS